MSTMGAMIYQTDYLNFKLWPSTYLIGHLQEQCRHGFWIEMDRLFSSDVDK